MEACRSELERETYQWVITVMRRKQKMQNNKRLLDAAPWLVSEFVEFMGRMQTPQRRLLGILIKHGTRDRDAGALCDALGLRDTNALDRILAEVSKTALALGIDEQRVYVQTPSCLGGKQRKVYRIASGFLRIAEQHNWPSEHELNELF